MPDEIGKPDEMKTRTVGTRKKQKTVKTSRLREEREIDLVIIHFFRMRTTLFGSAWRERERFNDNTLFRCILASL